MTPDPERRQSAVSLGWLALGLTVVALAFTIRPVKASSLVFWVVVLAGGSAVGFSAISHFRKRTSSHKLVGAECRRIYEAIKLLLEEQEQVRPRAKRFNGGRRTTWIANTIERYEDELQRWARKVFKQAVKVDALSEASRPLLDAKTPAQLATLRDLFRSAAEELEQRE